MVVSSGAVAGMPSLGRVLTSGQPTTLVLGGCALAAALYGLAMVRRGRSWPVHRVFAFATGLAVLVVSLGRTFPEGDCCWVEVFGTKGYERVPFLWGAPGDDVFHSALAAQAEAFAASVRGAEPVGAGVTDAVAALRSAELARDSLRESGARVPA